MSKGAQIALGATLVALLIGWYGLSTLSGEGAYRYFQTLDEFRGAGGPRGPARIHGYVVEGSIQRDLAAKVVRFAMQSEPPHAGGALEGTLPVTYASLDTPDLFKDGAEVVVEGALDEGDDRAVFHATKVLAKCPSKFEPEAPRRASF